MTRKLISLLLAIVIICSGTTIAFASGKAPDQDQAKAAALAELQQFTNGEFNFYENGGSFFLSGQLSSPETAGVKAATKFLDQYKALFGIKSVADQLKHTKTVKDNTGDTFVRFAQLIDGIEVYGSMVNVHFDKSGAIVSVNGMLNSDGSITAIGNRDISMAAAVDSAKKQFTFKSMRDKTEETKKLVLRKDGKNYTVYKVNVAFREPEIGNYNVYVEASSGDVILTEDKIRYDGPVTGSGVDVQGTERPLNLYLEEEEYQMWDETNPAIFAIITTGYSFVGPDDFYPELVTNSTSRFDTEEHKASVSAHYYAGIVVDFYYDMFGRNGIEDDGGPIYSETHYGDGYNNAFWDGYGVVYGDGDGTAFTYMSGDLDVVGHEMTHGVIDWSSMLYYQDQSGALNESLADVFGVMISTYEEYDVADGGTWVFDPTDWVIGDDIVTPAVPGDALRSLADPTLYGHPAHMDDYEFGTADYGGVHTNSGIPNKAAYLVAQSIGMEKTAKIYYQAMNYYLSMYSGFEDMLAALTMAADDLYGWYSDESLAVHGAFQAVGIEMPINDPYEPNNYMDIAFRVKPFAQYQSYITSLVDNDWYRFYVDHTDDYSIRLEDIAAGCDFNLTLYNKFGKEVASSANTGNTPEQIDITLTQQGPYTVKVNAYLPDGSPNDGFSKSEPYTLTVASDAIAVPAARAAAASYNSIKVSWNAVEGANAYEVYRSMSSNGTYSKVGTVTATNFINGSLKMNTQYFYKVRARRTATPAMTSQWSPVVSAIPLPTAPAAFQVAANSYNSIRISWNGVEGASGYELYRATSGEGPYTKLATTTAKSYINTGLTSGSAYIYKLRAFRTVNNTKVYGPFTFPKGAVPTLGAPASLTAKKVSSTSVKLTWSAVTGATGYELWRMDDMDFEPELVKSTASLYYTDTGLSALSMYVYMVRAYRIVGSTKIYGEYSDYAFVEP